MWRKRRTPSTREEHALIAEVPSPSELEASAGTRSWWASRVDLLHQFERSMPTGAWWESSGLRYFQVETGEAVRTWG